MTATKEKIVWESAIYKLRIVEVRMFITLEILTHRIDRFLNGNWQRVNSRATLVEAQWFVEYIFGVKPEEETECQQ
jgi:hypothetical protein